MCCSGPCAERLQKGITCFMVNHFTLNHLVFSWTFRQRPGPGPELLDEGELGWGPSVGWVSTTLLKSAAEGVMLRNSFCRLTQ